MSKINKLKAKLREEYWQYELMCDTFSCGEKLALHISSTLRASVTRILALINKLKVIELKVNGSIPDVLIQGEKEWREKLEGKPTMAIMPDATGA